MRLPPWLAAVLLALVLAALWWWGTGEGSDPDADRPTTTRAASAERTTAAQRPTGTPSGQPRADSDGDGAGDGPHGTDTRDWDDIEACADEELPAAMLPVVEDIQAGGPYEFDRDGITFGNYEGYLPGEARSYYREFTVPTPGLDHRGARRIVTGGGREADPEVWYYTGDHYESFCEFAP